MRPMRAALDGARQIGFTVISISVSLIAAFIPLLFMDGVVGRLLREFSVTLVFAIVVSTGGVADRHADDLRALRARGAEPRRHPARPHRRGGHGLDGARLHAHARCRRCTTAC